MPRLCRGFVTRILTWSRDKTARLWGLPGTADLTSSHLEVSMANRLLFFAPPVLLIVACTSSKTPTAPTSAQSTAIEALAHVGHGANVASPARADNPNSGAHDDKGYIDGWFNGEDVQLYYTKSFFCGPLSPGAPVPCELGAPPDTAPREGPIRTIYAIAAAPTIANLVDPATPACRAGTACLNHPLMIDLSRIGGSPTAGPAAHNHILTSRGAGWFQTVNIRVFSLAACDLFRQEIAETVADPADVDSEVRFLAAALTRK
jgi:hypothetical protein